WQLDRNIQLRNDDLLFTKDGSIGKVAHIRELPGPAALNSHLLVIRPRDGAFVPRFLYYVLPSQLLRDSVEVEKTGTTFHGIPQEAMSRFPGLLPPLDRQRAISDYLDAEIARIDALVAKKSQMIELLDERRWTAVAADIENAPFKLVPMRRTFIDITD